MCLIKGTRNLFRVLLILILSCSLLASCTQAPDGDGNDTPQNGAGDNTPPEGDTPPEEEISWKDKLLEGSNVSAGMAPPVCMRFFADTSEIDIESNLDVVLVYYLLGDFSVIVPTSEFSMNCKVTIECYNKENQNEDILEKFINEYDDYFTMSDGTFGENFDEYIFDGIKYRGRIDKITIPSDWFLYNKGVIVFVVDFNYTIPNNPEYEKKYNVVNAVALYYIKVGDTIKLFGSYYDFNNYGK